MFLKISQERPALDSLFNKVAGLRACDFIKKRLQHRCFPVKFVKLLRTPPLAASYDVRRVISAKADGGRIFEIVLVSPILTK